MTLSPALLAQSRTAVPDQPRARLTISIGLYGGALGAGALLVSLLSQMAPEVYPDAPRHPGLVPSLILSSGGFLVGALLAALAAYMAARDRHEPLKLLVWMAVGLGFGIMLPVFTGAIIPFTMVFINLYEGTIEAGDVLIRLVDSVFLAPWATLFQAVFGLFSSMLAGLVFGLGAWLVNVANAASKSWIARYGTYGLAAALSIAVIGFVTFGSPTFLAKLG